MKLYDIAMSIEHADQEVLVLEDSFTARIRFSGTADQLLDCPELKSRRVTRITAAGDVLKIHVRG